MRALAAAALALAAATTAGCAPLALSPAPATPPPITRAPVPGRTDAVAAPHEISGPLVRETPAASAGDPVSAVLTFASAYINWNAATVSRDMRALAQVSIGQARSAMQLAAAQTAQDYELARGGLANQGSVQAIGPVAGQRDQYAVVTLERTTATNSTAYAGLAAAWHVALATVTQVAPGRWAVSGWQPEN